MDLRSKLTLVVGAACMLLLASCAVGPESTPDITAEVATLVPTPMPGTFTDSGQYLGNANSNGIALGDLDGDGDIDAFVTNSSSDEPNEVWINNG